MLFVYYVFVYSETAWYSCEYIFLWLRVLILYKLYINPKALYFTQEGSEISTLWKGVPMLKGTYWNCLLFRLMIQYFEIKILGIEQKHDISNCFQRRVDKREWIDLPANEAGWNTVTFVSLSASIGPVEPSTTYHFTFLMSVCLS